MLRGLEQTVGQSRAGWGMVNEIGTGVYLSNFEDVSLGTTGAVLFERDSERASRVDNVPSLTGTIRSIAAHQHTIVTPRHR